MAVLVIVAEMLFRVMPLSDVVRAGDTKPLSTCPSSIAGDPEVVLLMLDCAVLRTATYNIIPPMYSSKILQYMPDILDSF